MPSPRPTHPSPWPRTPVKDGSALAFNIAPAPLSMQLVSCTVALAIVSPYQRRRIRASPPAHHHAGNTPAARQPYTNPIPKKLITAVVQCITTVVQCITTAVQCTTTVVHCTTAVLQLHHEIAARRRNKTATAVREFHRHRGAFHHGGGSMHHGGGCLSPRISLSS